MKKKKRSKLCKKKILYFFLLYPIMKKRQDLYGRMNTAKKTKTKSKKRTVTREKHAFCLFFFEDHASRTTEAISADAHANKLVDELDDHNDVEDDCIDAVVFTKVGPQPMSICWALGVYVLYSGRDWLPAAEA